MDLLGKEPAFNIYGTSGNKIYARNTAMPASYIARSAEIHESFVAEGCEVEGMVNHSILSTGCSIGRGAEISDSVIMPDVMIETAPSSAVPSSPRAAASRPAPAWAITMRARSGRSASSARTR